MLLEKARNESSPATAIEEVERRLAEEFGNADISDPELRKDIESRIETLKKRIETLKKESLEINS